MRVGITGASGFVGRAATAALRTRGDAVVAFVRAGSNDKTKTPDVEIRRFDVTRAGEDPSALEGLDAIIHLAGETVDGRWTQQKKQAIFDSRVAGTRNLVVALRALVHRPSTLVVASATGYYGDRGDEVLDESSPPGQDFLAGVCVAWEREAQAATALGLRVANLRTGVVFGPGGGALSKLRPIFNAGLGGPLGSGRQWMPWIHIDDLVAAYLFALDRDDVGGPMLAVAPDYASNARVMAAVAGALGRPAIAPAPGPALRLVLGEFAGSLLGGHLLLPEKAQRLGFEWRHPRLEAAMADAVAPGSNRRARLFVYENEQRLAASPAEVFSFFSETRNLERVTPPKLHWRVATNGSTTLRRGVTVDYRLRAWGVPLRWRSLAVEVSPDESLTDVQVRGPYLWWKHAHAFIGEGKGTLVRDRIEYQLPLAPLGAIAQRWVHDDIETAFAFRRRALEEIFPG